MVISSICISGGVPWSASWHASDADDSGSRSVPPRHRHTRSPPPSSPPAIAVFAGLIGRPRADALGRSVPGGRRFEALPESIAYQQLAGKAAASIWGRMRAASTGPFTPRRCWPSPGPSLRAPACPAGQGRRHPRPRPPRRSTATIRLDAGGRLPDDEVVDDAHPGAGRRAVDRPHVPDLRPAPSRRVADRRLRRARRASAAPGRAGRAARRRASSSVLGDRFRPYRSVVAWYCWRAADTLRRSARSRRDARA